MTSMSELMSKLADREQERAIAQQEATEGINACKRQVNEASEELMEFKRGREQELKVLKLQYEKQLRDTAFACRQRVQAGADGVAETHGRLESAEKRKWDLESKAFHLRLRVMELEKHMEQRDQYNDNRYQSLNRSMEARLKRITNQGDDRIQSMNNHALMLRESMYSGVESSQEEMQDQTARAHIRAEGRTRFKELCELAERTKSYDMSSESFQQIRDELLDLWKMQGKTQLASPRMAKRAEDQSMVCSPAMSTSRFA